VTPHYLGGPACGQVVPAHLTAQPRVVIEGRNRSGRVPLYLYIRQGADYVFVSEYDYARDGVT
jgi:hypothetical protein